MLRPMIIVYRLSWLTYRLARLLVRVNYIGLVNIIAGRPMVPELLQEALCPQTLAALALHCLEHPEVAQYIRSELAPLHHALGLGDGARRAAACVGQFLRPAALCTAPPVTG